MKKIQVKCENMTVSLEPLNVDIIPYGYFVDEILKAVYDDYLNNSKMKLKDAQEAINEFIKDNNSVTNTIEEIFNIKPPKILKNEMKKLIKHIHETVYERESKKYFDHKSIWDNFKLRRK